MKIKKSSSLMILALMLSSLAIGFLGSATFTSAEKSIVGDTEAIDLGYKIREGDYELDLNLEPLEMSSAALSHHSYWEVGDYAYWLYLDDYTGYYYLDYFQLRKIGNIVEVWVQYNISYTVNESRNEPWTLDKNHHYTKPEVSDAQIDYLVDEFENTIYPKDTSVFGDPDFHDGSNAVFDDLLGLDPEYYYEETGRNVILVSNIRDYAYYESSYPYYIGGFYSPTFEYYFDRNIFSMDTNQWYRRLGSETTQWWSEAREQYDPPVDRPYLYETLLGHEYQHLIHDDYNPADVTFMNEACSLYAETILGYPWETGDIETFLFTPDNSLTEWGDQGDINLLADYGAAMLWGLYLTDHFTRRGANFLGHFVQAGIPGIEGVNAALKYFHYRKTFDDVFLDWRIANLIHSNYPGHGRYNYKSVDLGALDTQALVHDGDDKNRGTEFGTTITDEGYDTGISMIAQYGTDYIEFDESCGFSLFLFDGDDYAPNPGWFYDDIEESWYSGGADLWNTLIAGQVYVDPANPKLYLTTYFDIEWYWDFGFVQVSEEGTWESDWVSLANDYTTSVHDPNAHPNVVENLPGFTGNTTIYTPDGIVTMEFDLTPYAGKDIYIGFRYVTDWGALEPGWWIYDAYVSSVDNKIELSHVLPKTYFMVTIVEERYSWKGKPKYHINNMYIFKGSNIGFDFALLSKKDKAYLLVSPMMEKGYTDYWFDVGSLFKCKWKW